MSARADREAVVEGYGVINIGRSEAFVVSKESDDRLCARHSQKKLPFKCEIIVCPTRRDQACFKGPFTRQPAGPDVTAVC